MEQEKEVVDFIKVNKSVYLDLKEELRTLRAWKKKAMPLIQEGYKKLDAMLKVRIKDDVTDKLEKDYKILKELTKDNVQNEN